MASSNVRVKSGYIVDLLTDPYNNTQDATTTGAVTGGWIFKDSPYTTYQAICYGTGACAATFTLQYSNDGINPIATSGGTVTLSGTAYPYGNANTTLSDSITASTAPYKYVRCVTSVVSGSIAALICKMGV